MENKVNYIQAINKSMAIPRKPKKNRTKSIKMGLRFFTMYFNNLISFLLSQNANHTYFRSFVNHQ